MNTRKPGKTRPIIGATSALAFAMLTLAGCGKSDSTPATPATPQADSTAAAPGVATPGVATPGATAPTENMPTGTGAHGDPGAPKSTPNGTGGTTEATGDNISTGSAGGVPNAGAANADNAPKSAGAASSPK